MKNLIKWICGLLVLVLLIAGAYFLYNKLSENYSSENIADNAQDEQDKVFSAPDFTVQDYDGKSIRLSDKKGKPVVLNFWASWCPPCREEMPDFQKAYDKYKDEVVFMMVNATDNQQETVKKAKKHIEENGYIFPVYFDTEYSASIAYQTSSIPMTFFIDENGNLITYAQGMIDYELLEKGIEMIR